MSTFNPAIRKILLIFGGSEQLFTGSNGNNNNNKNFKIKNNISADHRIIYVV